MPTSSIPQPSLSHALKIFNVNTEVKLRLRGLFGDTWVEGTVTSAYDGEELEPPDSAPGELYLIVNYANEENEDISWHDLQLRATGNHVSSRRADVKVDWLHPDVINLINPAPLKELPNRLPPRATGIKRQHLGADEQVSGAAPLQPDPSEGVAAAPYSSQENKSSQRTILPPATKRRKGSLSSAELAMRSKALIKQYCTEYNVDEETLNTWAGHIKEVHVENFMNHGNFHFKLQPNVTFISGKNGSGKSAVLQAMQVCLGVKAKETGRASSYSNFIKSGTHRATVSVTLWNTGNDAYKPDSYGCTIKVQRIISHTTVSKPLRFFDCTANEASHCSSGSFKPQRELQALLDHFNIVAKEPVVVTQEMAKKFAQSSGNDKLYDLYFRCMQFNETQNNLAEAISNIVQTREMLREAKTELKHLEVRKQQVSEQLELFTQVTTWQEELTVLRRYEVLRQVRFLRHVEAFLQQEIVQRANDSRNAEANKQRLEQLVEQRQQAVYQATNDFTAAEPRLQILQARRQAHRSEVGEAVRTYARLQRDAAAAQEELAVVQRQLQHARLEADRDCSDAQRATQAAEEDYSNRTQHLQQEVEAAQVAVAEARHELQVAAAAQDQAAAVYSEENKRVQQSAREVSQLQSEVSRLSNSTAGNGPAVFCGPNGTRLAQLIAQRAREFRRAPIGPIGCHLELLDGKWATAVEAAISSLLAAFIVDNDDDRELLQRLVQQSGVRCPIITMSFEQPRHQIPPHRQLSAPLITVLSQLRFLNTHNVDTILNVLMDWRGLEMVVLADNHDHGLDILRQNPQSRMINYVQCRDGDSCKLTGRSTSYTPASNRSNTRPRLYESRQEALNAARRDLQAAEAARARLLEAERQAQRNKTAAERDRQLCQQAVQRAQRHYTQTKAALERMQQEVAEYQMTQAVNDGDEAKQRVAELQRDLVLLQQPITELEESLRQAADAKKRAETDLEVVMRDIHAQTASVAELERNVQQTQMELEAARQELAAAEQQLVSAVDFTVVQEGLEVKLKEAEDVARGCGLVDMSEDAWLDYRDQARHAFANISKEDCGEAGSLMQLTKKYAAIGSVVTELERKLDRKIRSQETKAGGKYQQVQDLHVKLTDQCEKQRLSVVSCKASLKRLYAGYNNRSAKFLRVQNEIANKVNSDFDEIMRKRGWQGKVHVDDDAKQLIIEVTTSDGANVTDLKSLSGGERSYTTLSFILALGRSNGSPFYILDEYDVFMDANVRVIATRELLRHAWSLRGTQFIFLSPQDPSAVQKAKLEALRYLQRDEDLQQFPEHFMDSIKMPDPQRAHAS